MAPGSLTGAEMLGLETHGGGAGGVDVDEKGRDGGSEAGTRPIEEIAWSWTRKRRRRRAQTRLPYVTPNSHKEGDEVLVPRQSNSVSVQPVMGMPPNLPRRDGRIIVHVDYDAFYASVFEAETPALRSVPLAVQQKQIIVTCNYKARQLGLRKLQLVSEAKKLLPDLVIVLGEELGRFRDASKALYNFLQSFAWSGKVERLGFDEVFLDVTDIVDYNQALLNPHDLPNSFFQLNPSDPTIGFSFDATTIAGHSYPHTLPRKASPTDNSSSISTLGNDEWLTTRLILGSHFARHIRLQLEEDKGYTSTVGISTNKLLSKLAGNVNKPKAQTTLLPPYLETQNEVALISAEPLHDSPIREDKIVSNITTFLDEHDIGKIPGIGFKMAQRIRNYVLSKPADADTGSIYGGTTVSVTVRSVRLFPGMGPDKLEEILGGPGSEHGIGGKVWELIHGIDNTEVKDASKVPSQISIEDSYRSLDSLAQVRKELRMLATSLIQRMHIDLLEVCESNESSTRKRWIAHPKTIRLSTRPRASASADGTRARLSHRISKSGPIPNFVFNLKESIDTIVEKLVQETLIPMFRKLHPQPAGWNLSLLNIGVTNLVETASEDGSTGGGRDIGSMFKRQESVLREWKVEDKDTAPDSVPDLQDVQSHSPGLISAQSHGSSNIHIHDDNMNTNMTGSEDQIQPTQESALWQEDDDTDIDSERCSECGAVMPAFAMAAHHRFHSLED
ncbi:hypothetical protein B7463_g8331, partial [Scytalidium lignicola]